MSEDSARAALMAARAGIATARQALDEAEQAIASELGEGAPAPPKAWPPDPASIDLDDGTWLSPQQAAGVAHLSVDTIYARCATSEIAIKIGGRWSVSRERLMTPGLL